MSRCLGDRRLWLLSEGEASPEDRAHVAACGVCAARLRRLARDLSHVRSVLSGPVPPLASAARRRPVQLRWMASAATLAAMIVLSWFGLWWQQSSPPLVMEVGQESIWSFIEGVSAALFSSIDGGFTVTADRLPELDDLRAALAGEWPCSERMTFVDLACEDNTFALLAGEP